MLITCKCLNITVEAKETENKNNEFGSFKLSSVEELENFFKEDIREVQIVAATKQIASLIQGKSVGLWRVEHCLNCSVTCYATNINSTAALINASLITTIDAIVLMRSHRDFSPVFRIIIQPISEGNAFSVASERQPSGKMQNILTPIQQQLSECIQNEVAKTEERIRTFSEEQYAKLEDFQDRAAKDYKAVTHKIYEVQVPFQDHDAEISDNIASESHRVDNVERSLNDRLLAPKDSATVSAPASQENEFKARPVISRPINPYSRISENIPGSLDSEGLFVLEGMEDVALLPTIEPYHSEGESDSEHEDSGSHDEGIDVHSKPTPSNQMAKSLPVNVPSYSSTPSEAVKKQESPEPSAALDIAASIKALARSVHSDAVFGDLPRPRFSTQI